MVESTDKTKKTGQTKKKVGRPRKLPVEKPDVKVVQIEDDDYVPLGELENNVFGGVSRTWLAKVFKMDIVTVTKRLANCPTKGKRSGTIVYDLQLAAQYLVKPRVDIGEYIKNMRPNDLPPILQSAYWDAQTKRQTWEIKAGNLWHTDNVIEVFSETFKLLKTSVMLFVDSVEQETNLTELQRSLITNLSDGLMNDIHESLVNQHKIRSTKSQFFDLDSGAPGGGVKDNIGDII